MSVYVQTQIQCSGPCFSPSTLSPLKNTKTKTNTLSVLLALFDIEITPSFYVCLGAQVGVQEKATVWREAWWLRVQKLAITIHYIIIGTCLWFCPRKDSQRVSRQRAHMGLNEGPLLLFLKLWDRKMVYFCGWLDKARETFATVYGWDVCVCGRGGEYGFKISVTLTDIPRGIIK